MNQVKEESLKSTGIYYSIHAQAIPLVFVRSLRACDDACVVREIENVCHSH